MLAGTCIITMADLVCENGLCKLSMLKLVKKIIIIQRTHLSNRQTDRQTDRQSNNKTDRCLDCHDILVLSQSSRFGAFTFNHFTFGSDRVRFSSQTAQLSTENIDRKTTALIWQDKAETVCQPGR